jgi:hypothetical protein
MTNTAILVNDYAVLDAQIKELTEKRDAIKKQLLGVAQFEPNKKGVLEAVVPGDVANIIFTKTYPTTFSKDLAETLLSAEDFLRCHATAINPTIRPRVAPKAAAFVTNV